MELPAGLLATKLMPPAPRPDAVPRPALLAELGAGLDGRLVLLAASAGFGKTTLLAQWLHSADPRSTAAVWLALDPADNDPVRFWSHLLAGLDRVVPGTGAAAGLLHAPGRPAIEDVLADPVNTVTAHGAEAVLVLDDYHAVTNPEIHRGMSFLLDRLPDAAHLVISTRADPPMPLARLRARGQLCEIRTGDLRLSTDETGTFLRDTMSLGLAPGQVRSLHRRTEGWVAGLQLAALALRHRPSTEDFVDRFAGTDRFIVDYLIEEVLAGQPAEVVDFLRRTAVLDRFCGPLCEELAGAGQEMLESLERQNLFLVPLDGVRRWYRYHPLFADVLRARLVGDAERAELHRRASAWFERAGDLPGAVDHALAVPDLDRVADLLEAVPRVQFLTPIQTALHRWLAALPPELVRRRPALALLEAWRRLQSGDPAGARQLAAEVEAAATAPDTLGELAVLRGFLKLGGPRPDAPAVLAEAELALDRLDADNTTFRGMAQMVLGHAALLRGDAARTETAFAESERLGRAGDAPHLAVMGGLYLTAAHRAAGRHRRAEETARAAIERTAAHPAAVAGRVGLVYGQLADLALERGDPVAAAGHAEQSVAGARLMGLPPMLSFSRLAQARIRLAAGDVAGALADLPDVPAAGAIRAQAALVAGDVASAVRWAEAQPAPVEQELLSGGWPGALVVAVAYDYEHVRIAPAQVWLAAGEHDRALAALDVQARAADAFHLGWLRTKVLALRALAYAGSGDPDAALRCLEAALDLAAPEGHVRLFAAEGAPMAGLLTRVRQRRAGVADAYLDDLIRACAPAHPDAGPLSGRELDVLRLIAAGCDNPEIGRRLFVAPSTVKTHVNRIFGKLGVVSRTQAVARARELDLL